MLTITSKYALRAMLALARSAPSEFVLVKTLSEISGVPAPYLSKIIKTLAADQLVETKKGSTGGVRLNPDFGPISFYDVCSALNDPVATDSCFLSKKACSHTAQCQMHERWEPLRDRLLNFLKDMKISAAVSKDNLAILRAGADV